VGGQDGMLYLLGADDLRDHWSVQAHFYGLSQIDFSSDGARLFTVGDDQHIKVWNSRDGKAANPYSELRRGSEKAHTGMIKTLALFDGGRKAVSGAYWDGGNIKSYKSLDPPDHVLRIWDLQTGEAVQSFPYEWGVRCCIQTADENLISFMNIHGWGESDSTVRLFDLTTHKQVQVFHDDSPTTDVTKRGAQAFAPVPRSTLIVIGLRSGRYILWDYVTNQVAGAFVATDSLWFVIDGELHYDGSPDGVLKSTPETAGILSARKYMRSSGLLAKLIASRQR
jgi:WD40 repeat protein